ncbi:MAG: methionine transporter ATP-binding protein [Gemmatimonadetes bacterium]|jgi:ABC-type proline/glycine betaine transport system ATPase subunit|nr:methionine transporter ATP-binding protein [Gemmatimonadota bacterium]
MTEPVLELKALRPQHALHAWRAPLSLQVEEGTFLTIVTSPSQAAALFRLVLGLETPAAGAIRVLGGEPHGLSRSAARTFRRRIGSSLLPDGLMANITLRANVALPLVFGDGRSHQEADERTDEVLTRFSLERWADRRPSDLPPDTRQVAAVARAVAARPALLLLHDPLTAMGNSEAVRLMRICREYVSTIVSAVHSEDEAVCLLADTNAVWDEHGYQEMSRA